MDDAVTVEIIHTAPVILWTLIVVAVLVYFRRPLGDLLGRIGKVKLFGVEAEFASARDQLIKASQSYDTTWDEREVNTVISRAERIRDWLNGSRILWVDDLYLANANIFRFLNSYGVVIDKAATTEEALIALRWAGGAYEVVVTDMIRGHDDMAGLHLIDGLDSLGIVKPVIVFVAQLDPQRGTPPGAVAITDRPIDLIHEIMNVIERKPRAMTR